MSRKDIYSRISFLRAYQTEDVAEELDDTLKRLEVLKNTGFRRKGRQYKKELYSRFSESLSRCMDAYAEYLDISRNYQRARIIQESYCSEGKIEYRIRLLSDYVENELEDEENIKYIMIQGYSQCIVPVLDEAAKMRERLESAGRAEPFPEPSPDELLFRYFQDTALYKLVTLTEAARKCRASLDKLASRDALEAARKESSLLRRQSVELRTVYKDEFNAAICAEISHVTEELKTQSRMLAQELEHYERLAGRIIDCTSSLDEKKLAAVKNEQGSYSDDPDLLAELKQAYAEASEKLKEVTEIGRYRETE